MPRNGSASAFDSRWHCCFAPCWVMSGSRWGFSRLQETHAGGAGIGLVHRDPAPGGHTDWGSLPGCAGLHCGHRLFERERHIWLKDESINCLTTVVVSAAFGWIVLTLLRHLQSRQAPSPAQVRRRSFCGQTTRPTCAPDTPAALFDRCPPVIYLLCSAFISMRCCRRRLRCRRCCSTGFTGW